MEVSSQLHTLAALLLGAEPLPPMRQEAGWVTEPVWIIVVKKDNPCP